jgi:hypothetical protein
LRDLDDPELVFFIQNVVDITFIIEMAEINLHFFSFHDNLPSSRFAETIKLAPSYEIPG